MMELYHKPRVCSTPEADLKKDGFCAMITKTEKREDYL